MSNFSVAAVFSDHMVLQRNKFISIFGTGDEGLYINVKLLSKDNQILAENNSPVINGAWEIQLEPQIARTDCSLIISATDTQNGAPEIVFSDVAIGEVWLAGGQSNMEFELQNCSEADDELGGKNEKPVSNPNVRFYYTNKISWMDQHFYDAEKNTCWQTWDSEGRKSWSAVGYFFGKKLAADLDCVVGIIGCNWGGTSASCWMDKSYLQADKDLETYLTEQEEATKGKSIEQQLKDYDDYEVEMAKWQAGFDKLWQEDHNITWESAVEILGTNPWPGPRSCKNPYRPTGLYECMLKRIIPYTLKGVIWYQGESDDHKPNSYYKLFANMIDNWRNDWNDSHLPFVFVQLPEHRYKQDKDFKHWCLIREAQQKIHNTIKNAFMTTALDLGQYNDIHPKAKKVLGERMAKNALANVYNLLPSSEVLSPMFASSYINNSPEAKGSITLVFNHAATGFDVHDDELELEYYKQMEENQGTPVPENFTGFEIAGRDGVFYPAKYAFGGSDAHRNQIILCSPEVPQPVVARYAWYNYGPVTIFGKNGLPLAPFRTSVPKQSETTEHAKIQQIMTV